MIEVNLDLSEARIVLEDARRGFKSNRFALRRHGGKVFAIEVIALANVPIQRDAAIPASFGAEDECLVHVERPLERRGRDGKQGRKE
jgi:hypothetical protein